MARVKTLKAMGIHASYLTLTTSRTDKKRILASLRDGMTSILYIPIVYTAHHSIQSALGNVPGGIRVLVVDQADRTSQSTTSYGDGHHHVAHFVEKVTPHIVHFQTDKSTKKIAKDICAKFMIDETNVIQSLDSLPANIELRVVSVRTSHNKYAALCGLLVRFWIQSISVSGTYDLSSRSAPIRTYLSCHAPSSKCFMKAARHVSLHCPMKAKSRITLLTYLDRIVAQAKRSFIPLPRGKKCLPANCEATAMMSRR